MEIAVDRARVSVHGPSVSRAQVDTGLVMEARSGDRAAFASLHRSFAPMVHAVLLARVPAQEAEDLVQDVFVKALAKLHTLTKPEAIGAWLATLARNRAADFYRSRKRHATLPDEIRAPLRHDMDAREVLAAIRALPESYCETLIMRLVQGMTGPEIADRTGLTPGSVRVNLHRGMKMLRKRLHGDCDE